MKDFLSYCRLVKGMVASAARQSLDPSGLRAKRHGCRPRLPLGLWRSGRDRHHTIFGPLGQRLEAQFGGNKSKANTVLAIKLARAVYFMLKTKTVFDPERLIAALSRKSFGPGRRPPARSN